MMGAMVETVHWIERIEAKLKLMRMMCQPGMKHQIDELETLIERVKQSAGKLHE
jgi:hypothetical protein